MRINQDESDDGWIISAKIARRAKRLCLSHKKALVTRNPLSPFIPSSPHRFHYLFFAPMQMILLTHYCPRVRRKRGDRKEEAKGGIGKRTCDSGSGATRSRMRGNRNKAKEGKEEHRSGVREMLAPAFGKRVRVGENGHLVVQLCGLRENGERGERFFVRGERSDVTAQEWAGSAIPSLEMAAEF